ncbi:hypothetical protein CLAFUW4_14764 [Fulvia fulva]|uniref:Uncharacterized protein n=1 Tax=Passalora fulva TaxID=5499 RepID=A0A9Q8PME7_PASFU|nr:uncharacterized protein CLAFUR5_14590 [Fulvia fulva]KAK4609198.1 hypothetical protein CLAFUR4_14756 [Fulvia fulva]KAK4609500.1 hypothetical protein CLAFUR0_14756 [Fulvia fulva]UJO25143.1 hypothetical protein CLAFUR5_14590 [Fulvia fulva]WPV22755.1 hypothetical protein CLAFUW4_14764 [Fulvia fulva]WPV37649.1 hypothetical protein CLAFUW7_14765 [Fulvia fulva]
MRIAHLLPFLAASPAVLGGPVPESDNTQVLDSSDTTAATYFDGGSSDPIHHMQQKSSSDSLPPWPPWGHIPYKGKKDLKMLRYAGPDCRPDDLISWYAQHFDADDAKDLHGKGKEILSVKYALPNNAKMQFVDVTFWDGHHEKHHGCTGNIVYKLDGARGETADGDQYACHNIAGAKCLSLSPAWKSPSRRGTWWKSGSDAWLRISRGRLRARLE